MNSSHKAHLDSDLAPYAGRSFTRYSCSNFHSTLTQPALLKWSSATSSSVLTCLFFAFLWVTPVLFGQEPTERRPNIILISIDTLRSDRLGCTGYTKSSTPNLDLLAQEGTLFEHVYTPAPLTLPAHASLFTSSYPSTHGVRDNGEILISSIPTLAEQFRKHGYQTAAFIGSFVLDRRFGLARGFDSYWGEFPLHRFAGADPGEVQIRGDRVEAAAEQWIGLHGSSPFFLFIHFYDLHGPYLLPDPWRTRFPGRVYDGELAYVDSLIGKLRRKLQQSDLDSRTALVVTSDHGEGLGDHGERNHGFFLYRSTTQIPLIIHVPNRARKGSRVNSTARLIDIAPTLTQIAGLPTPASFEGRSLWPEMEGQVLAPVAAYSETLYPYLHFHTSPLYAYRTHEYGYIQAPRPELYKITDVAELHDQATTQSALATSLQNQLSKLISSFPRAGASLPSSVGIQRLRSLGYLAGGTSSKRVVFPPTSGADPKDRISLFRRFQDVLEAQTDRRTERAAAEIEQIAASEPELVIVQIEAGLARQRLGHNERAIEHFRKALATNPQNALAHYNLAVSLSNLGRFSDAERELNVSVLLQPWFSQAYTARGLAQGRLGKTQDALASFDRAIAIDMNDFMAWLNRGLLRAATGDFSKALMDLEKAIAIEPQSSEAHLALGTAAFDSGDTPRALEEYLRAIRLNPRSSSAHSELGILYVKQGKLADAKAQFEKALALDSRNKDAIEGLRTLR